jgi:hypothetical protein
MGEQVLSFSDAPVNRGSKQERRAWVRFPTSREACCQPNMAATAEERDTGWLGRLRDISAGGLALLLRRRFEPGALLIIDLSDKLQAKERSFAVHVVHATPEGKRRWIIGCEFISPLSEEELQAFVGG